jgi:nucleotide-binding universal stress UspA family protein
MYANILLCTDGSELAVVATQYAVWLAQRLQARLRALYVTDIRLLEGPWLMDVSGAIGAQPYTALLPQLREIQTEKARTILAAVADRCQKSGVECTTTHETGALVPTMLEQERRADLVVLGQRGEHARWAAGHLGSSVERLVRASIKPCLITSNQFREVKRVILAYDGSAESKHALQVGIDLARALGAEATILTACQRENEDPASQLLQEAHRQALDAQLTVHAQLMHGDPETEILRCGEKTGADLIVMGAYGHTRIRELILGSTTSHVVRKATVPVLLVRR